MLSVFAMIVGSLVLQSVHDGKRPRDWTATELRAIAPDWPSRVANYATFMRQELRDFIKSEGIHLIGYRQLRDLL